MLQGSFRGQAREFVNVLYTVNRLSEAINLWRYINVYMWELGWFPFLQTHHLVITPFKAVTSPKILLVVLGVISR